jgi:hypothetical protein
MKTEKPEAQGSVVAAKRAAIVASLGLLLTSGLSAFGGAKPDYDPVESRAKLEAIGRALQIYRQEYGVKPVGERRTMADAGMPRDVFVLAQPGHAWSLPDGEATFKLSGVRIPHLGRSDYFMPYLSGWMRGERGDGYRALLSGRGESLIVMYDSHISVDSGLTPPARRVLVLRLGGTVEEIVYTDRGFSSIWSQ